MADSKTPATPAKPPSKNMSGKAADKPQHAPKAKPTTAPKGKTAPKAEKKDNDVKIVDKAATPEKHVAKAKPQLTKEQQEGLRLRKAIASRRPTFRRQQWYEYKKLEDSGWRYPRGVDSAMRRHFGYEQSVVRIGFRGPAEVRGLHPTGFVEVRVETVKDLEKIDPKTQAARVSGNLGARKLKLVYAEADKRGVRILNRRRLA